ncbi:hypothetical protein T492DRAFT_1019585 [Pavlovales sp. CCMP2436]|nr:hypothetical protein T492DRAFT_1019585 [Pavlovales sp. CCMP2436]|mmetsp:Transcript_31187/g.71633  ORF Transcript_31187/g.71633 Transcript_31187/m.71633 type:complete len:495 (+) Transcript_31187:475-1959(+)
MRRGGLERHAAPGAFAAFAAPGALAAEAQGEPAEDHRHVPDCCPRLRRGRSSGSGSGGMASARLALLADRPLRLARRARRVGALGQQPRVDRVVRAPQPEHPLAPRRARAARGRRGGDQGAQTLGHALRHFEEMLPAARAAEEVRDEQDHRLARQQRILLIVRAHSKCVQQQPQSARILAHAPRTLAQPRGCRRSTAVRPSTHALLAVIAAVGEPRPNSEPVEECEPLASPKNPAALFEPPLEQAGQLRGRLAEEDLRRARTEHGHDGAQRGERLPLERGAAEERALVQPRVRSTLELSCRNRAHLRMKRTRTHGRSARGLVRGRLRRLGLFRSGRPRRVRRGSGRGGERPVVRVDALRLRPLARARELQQPLSDRRRLVVARVLDAALHTRAKDLDCRVATHLLRQALRVTRHAVAAADAHARGLDCKSCDHGLPIPAEVLAMTAPRREEFDQRECVRRRITNPGRDTRHPLDARLVRVKPWLRRRRRTAAAR